MQTNSAQIIALKGAAEGPAAGTAPQTTAVALKSVVKDYKSIRALDDISLTIPESATVGFIGCNGAGKTTTIFTIMGLIAPSSGSVSVFGADIVREPYKVLHRMNFASPYLNMPARLSVRRNLLVFARLYGVKDAKHRLAQLAHEFELGDIMDRAFGTLSSGQKTRVAIAKALLNEPDLLLLDEPTASLDPDRAAFIHQRLEAYREKHHATILLTSHNLTEVERLCDLVVVMRFGRIVEQGSPEDLKTRYGGTTLYEAVMEI
ncbi:MAG: ABC transporter ATP-binding protein [Methylovirgula sp.]